jgi:hypothetical protein
MSFFKNLFRSVGVKRSAAALLGAIFAGAIQHPAVAPFAPILLEIVGVIGGAGILHSAATGNVKIEK